VNAVVITSQESSLEAHSTWIRWTFGVFGDCRTVRIGTTCSGPYQSASFTGLRWTNLFSSGNKPIWHKNVEIHIKKGSQVGPNVTTQKSERTAMQNVKVNRSKSSFI